MKNILIFLLFISSINCFGQIEAYINDGDGYTNVREGETTESKIISTIPTAELFHCEPERESIWWRVQKRDGKVGFVHHSRIVPVTSQAVVIERFFKEIEEANPNNVEFGETSNEDLFEFAERYPKSFLIAFAKLTVELEKRIVMELETPIHDLIDLKLIYKRISMVEGLSTAKTKIQNALIVAGNKLNIDVAK